MHSAHKWQEFTGKPEFMEKFTAAVRDKQKSNEDRAAAVEKLVLEQAIEAGVVKKIQITQPRNPNKWGKTLAPWFNDTCREAKRELAEMKKLYCKGDNCII
jgi:hypothetical protein